MVFNAEIAGIAGCQSRRRAAPAAKAGRPCATWLERPRRPVSLANDPAIPAIPALKFH
jgi:hypothetical protein